MSSFAKNKNKITCEIDQSKFPLQKPICMCPCCEFWVEQMYPSYHYLRYKLN